MKRLSALLGLAFFGCGGPDDAFILEANQGGSFIIIEMPVDGTTDSTISALDIGVFDVETNALLVNLKFNNNDLKGLPNGAWPTTKGTCVPLRASIDENLASQIPPAEVPATFLPSNSSCLTFSLVHAFSEVDQTDTEKLVTLSIQAKNGSNTIKAQLAHTVRIERGIFKGDPAAAKETANLQPSIATLQVVVTP